MILIHRSTNLIPLNKYLWNLSIQLVWTLRYYILVYIMLIYMLIYIYYPLLSFYSTLLFLARKLSGWSWKEIICIFFLDSFPKVNNCSNFKWFFSWLMDILFKNIRILLSNVQIEEKILLLFLFLQLLLPEATGGCNNTFSTFNQDHLMSL